MGRPPTPRLLPCAYEGDIIRPCPSGNCVQRHVRECDIKGETTWADCARCEFRTPDTTLLDPPPADTPRLVLTLATDGHVPPSHARYAGRIGATHRVLTGTAGWRVATYEKWRYHPYVARAGRTLCIDADTWIHRDCPDVFEAVPPSHVGMNRVDPWLLPGFQWRRELSALCESQGVPTVADDAYYNAGVWVGSRRHAAYWEAPPLPGRLPGKWCDEEQWGRVQCARHALPIHALDKRFNYQWYLDKDFARIGAVKPWIVHLAGMGTQPADKPWRSRILNLLEAYER